MQEQKITRREKVRSHGYFVQKFPRLAISWQKKAQCLCKGPWFPSVLCPSFLSHLNFFPLLLIPSIPATLNLLLFIGQPKHMSASGHLHKLLPVLGTVFIHLHKAPAFRSDLCSNAVLSIRFSLTTLYKPAASTISQWYLLLPVSWSPVAFVIFSRTHINIWHCMYLLICL